MIIPGQVRKYWIPASDIGTYRTLQIMKQIVNESLTDPYVVQKAKSIVFGCNGKDTRCMATKILEWVKSHTIFMRDPSGIELLHTPKFMLQTIDKQGYIQIDCDDWSILTASLGKAVGMRSKFVVLGFLQDHAPLTHVYTLLELVNKRWMPLDQKGMIPIPKRFITRKEFFNV